MQNYAQPGIVKRVVVLGNTSQLSERSSFFSAIRNVVPFDSNTTVLFLGNYSGSEFQASDIDNHVDIVQNTAANVFFIPGYEEWSKGTEAGYASVLAQQQYIESAGNKRVKMFPGDGCPGLKTVSLGDHAEMLIIDSQWWLHEHSKPGLESSCKHRTKEELLATIENLPQDNYNKLMVLVAYHPFKNTGVHSGTFGPRQHIFPLTDIRRLSNVYLPLPVIGSLYPIIRNGIISKQDMNNEPYERLVEKGLGTLPGVRRALSGHPFTIFVSGQEHNLQLLHEGTLFFINSGAAVGRGRVRRTDASEFVSPAAGFTILEITSDKEVRSRFFEIRDGKAEEVFNKVLLQYSQLPVLPDTASVVNVFTDSVTAVANRNIAGTKGLKRLLVGENHRKEWGAQVKMPVFRPRDIKGGLRITGIGGSHESTSLQLEGPDGTEWVLRSMNKNVTAVIPVGFHRTIVSDYTHNILSGVNPYGSMVVPGLQAALGIMRAKPELFFVANDTGLGYFRPVFANTVMQLEERRPSWNDNDLVSTNEMLNEMIDRSDHWLDQKKYLTVRLVDFLIADFDRHAGQYGWGWMDTAGRKLFYPVPKDRDQALYNNTGAIMSIARKMSYKFMVNFPYSIKNVRDMGIVGSYMDLVFLNQLTESDWQHGLAEFKYRLSDSVISSSVHALPHEIYDIRGAETIEKLESRRNDIASKGTDYYKFIARKVPILGGNKNDVFKVTGDGQGLRVQVFVRDSAGNDSLRYSRSFTPGVTREIRLYGFGGNDYFQIDESARSSIRLKIVGGTGNDTFDLKGSVRNQIYDHSLESNEIVSRSHTTKLFRRKASVNEYVFREPMQNSLQLPALMFGYNADNGVLVGFGALYKTYGFKTTPYASKQKLSSLFALTHRAYRLKYSGEFNNVLRYNDLVVQSELFYPALRNFFGYGNETKTDPLRSPDYYRTKLDYLSADVLVRKRFLNDSVMSISAGPAVYYYWNNVKLNKGRILESPQLGGLDSSGVYRPKFYAGGKAVITIHNLNSELLPTRGISWTTELTVMRALSHGAEPFSRVLSDLDLYATLGESNRLLAALHLGGGHIFSDNFEYFQSLSLGGNKYLRGYRSNRFAGSSAAYAAAELKVKLFDFNAYIIKCDFGLVGFNDIGRVWVKNETSHKWHHGYGGGFYVIPFNAVLLSFVTAFSEEDQLFNLTLGARINMLFQEQ